MEVRMKAPILIVLGFLTLIIFVSYAKAGETTEPGQTHEVELQVGEIFKVCKSGIVVCPAIVSICDDPNIVTLVNTPDGLGFKGVAPGTTLCSVGTTVGPRRLFRVTVR
ncbi:MAG TPA: hypothetical protein VLG45_10385 [Thermodesulfobacteriota bacterium]|nr:hypothetical protein [Thermodesulfobacteriota bacterium]